jgi:hypothetical protein
LKPHDPSDADPHRGFGYAATLGRFLSDSPAYVLGHLQQAAAHLLSGRTEHYQVAAWNESIGWLRSTAGVLNDTPTCADWHLVLEYQIPRRRGRIDAVLLADDLIYVIEFKSDRSDRAAERQAEDYGLELLDFHEASHSRRIFPIVCASKSVERVGALNGHFGVAEVSTCIPDSLPQLLLELQNHHHEPSTDKSPIDPSEWLRATYAPTPTIIEAARALYAGHDVRELSQSQASAEHLARSSAAISGIVRETLDRGGHTLCLLTGIPGAGKTLAGLNIVHDEQEGVASTFLSGNGPLVKVLQHVLANDLADRTGVTKAAGLRKAETLVTNVHRWLDEYHDRRPDVTPRENVVVFDEAQRAWSREHSMRKFKRDKSEPEMMLEVLSRHDAAVLVALVGGGQEINTGEAGLSEWGRALSERFKSWRVAIDPDQLDPSRRLPGSRLFDESAPIPSARIQLHPDLHLAVSQRSFRARTLTDWVEAVLLNRPSDAAHLMEQLSHFPIVLTRDLERARNWIRQHARGERRSGLLASSGARRLRPHGIAVQERIDEVDWFLRPPDDVRSSRFLELAASEFGVQGLEVDWSCLAWGGDLLRDGAEWELRKFVGTAWRQVKQDEARRYVINRYRVLLTRAREGMAIWVPPGDPRDPTRDPARYDGVEDYLLQCGVKTI